MANEAELNPDLWIQEHGDYLYRYAYSRLREHGTAEDAVQETLLAAYRAKDRFSGTGSERAWLMGILKHKVVDHIRKAARETELEDPELVTNEHSFLFKGFGITDARPPSWQFDPRKAFEQREFWEVFNKCLGGLNERIHAAFVLRELEGMPTEEICKKLEVSPNNLWVMIHRARALLKICLEKNWLQRNQDSAP